MKIQSNLIAFSCVVRSFWIKKMWNLMWLMMLLHCIWYIWFFNICIQNNWFIKIYFFLKRTFGFFYTKLIWNNWKLALHFEIFQFTKFLNQTKFIFDVLKILSTPSNISSKIFILKFKFIENRLNFCSLQQSNFRLTSFKSCSLLHVSRIYT